MRCPSILSIAHLFAFFPPLFYCRWVCLGLKNHRVAKRIKDISRGRVPSFVALKSVECSERR